MRPRRIVLTSYQYHPDYPSGANRLAYDEALFLARQGHEVWMIVSTAGAKTLLYRGPDGLNVLSYPVPGHRGFDPRRRYYHQKMAADLIAKHITRPIDVIHGHALLPYMGGISLLRKSSKSCYTIHSPVSLEMIAGGRNKSPAIRVRLSLTARFAKNIEKKCIRDSDFVTADSDFTRTLIHKIHGSAYSAKIVKVPGWVDLDRFEVCQDRERLKSQLGWPLDRPVFFTLRRLVARTGIDRLLHAVHEVRSRGFRFELMIGGSGPLKGRLERLAGKLAVEDRVSFLGHVTDEDLPAMYAAADAFVLPTAELECFGLIALEAMACGRPVLATPVGAIPEMLDPIEPGWLCRDNSAAAIADKLIAFLKRELPDHDPEHLRQEIATRYSQAILVKKMTDIYLEEHGAQE